MLGHKAQINKTSFNGLSFVSVNMCEAFTGDKDSDTICTFLKSFHQTTTVNSNFHIYLFYRQVLYSEDAKDISTDISKCITSTYVDDLQYKYNYNISWNVFLTTVLDGSKHDRNFTICATSLTPSLNDVISSFSFITLKRYIIVYILTESDIVYLLQNSEPIIAYLKHHNLEQTVGLSKFTDYSCAKQIAGHLPMGYVIGNRISDEFNSALKQTFSELIKSIEEIIKQLYWVPSTQRQHLLSELQGLDLVLEWSILNDTFKDISHNFTSDYANNMLTMIQYSAQRYLEGKSTPLSTDKGDSIIIWKNRHLGEFWNFDIFEESSYIQQLGNFIHF